jgi:hypothetical protein
MIRLNILWANVFISLAALSAATCIYRNEGKYWVFLLYGPVMLLMTSILLRIRHPGDK